MNYKIANIFYSLQGEGVWTGTPMVFIRLAGCNLKCKWCDTNYSLGREMSSFEILKEINPFPSNRVLITGGEPLLQDLTALLLSLYKEDYKVHIETNCTFPLPKALWEGDHWVAVCPKSKKVNLDTLEDADEVKILVGKPGWKAFTKWILSQRKELTDPYFLYPEERFQDNLFLMPLENAMLEKNRNDAIYYCLKNPQWSLCARVHRILNFD